MPLPTEFFKSGRLQSEILQLQLTTVQSPILKATSNRVAIFFGGNPGGAVQYAPFSGGAGHVSVNVPTATTFITLTKDQLGECINNPWYGTSDAGTVGTLVIAVYDAEQQ